MADPWLGIHALDLAIVIATIVVMYVATLLLTRVVGLRSLSEMAPLDFTITIAIGGVIAIAIMNPDQPILEGLVAIGGLYALQAGVAVARRRWDRVRRWIQNDPILLAYDGEIIQEHMEQAEVTTADLMKALRRNNIATLDDVIAVVLEVNGEISVVQQQDGDRQLEKSVFDVVHLGEWGERLGERGEEDEQAEEELEEGHEPEEEERKEAGGPDEGTQVEDPQT